MNELLDRLAIQLLFLCLIIIFTTLFYYIYNFFYSDHQQFSLRKLYPSKNSAHSIHLFIRLFSLIFILSGFTIKVDQNIWFSLLIFTFYTLFFSLLYGATLYILDSITLYNFEFDVEIFARKNISYALISASNAFSAALIIKNIAKISFYSIIDIIFLWLLSTVLLGFSIKLFPYIFKQSLNRHVVQKNLSIALTYIGFIIANALIINAAFPTRPLSFEWYSIYVITSILLFVLLTSLIFWALHKILKIQNDYKGDLIEDTHKEPEIGHGIHQGVLYFIAGHLAIIITTKVIIGSFYPIITP